MEGRSSPRGLRLDCEATGDFDDDSASLEVDKVAWENGDVYHGTWKVMPLTLPNGKLPGHVPPGGSPPGGSPNGGGGSVGSVMQRKMHGAGIFMYSSGDFYQGDFRNGMRHGYGEYFWPNGMRYYGEWRSDMRDGRGLFYDARGHRAEDYYTKDRRANQKCPAAQPGAQPGNSE
mmetsp:Transcript_67728/g.153261  ORF Transcript_67728/g.153261 Transcript_67728/m.153261 type:complete len:174 (+) Transcript_67728:398-919(+)